MKYSLKKHLLNEAKSKPNISAKLKNAVEKDLKKSLKRFLNELDGEWQVSEPTIYKDALDVYIMTCELNPSQGPRAEMRLGFKVREETFYHNKDWRYCPYAYLRIGDRWNWYEHEGFDHETLTYTMGRVMQKFLNALTFHHPELLKNTSKFKKQIPNKRQVAEIKDCIKKWCKEQRFGSDPRDIEIDSSGLNGAVRTDYDQRDFYDLGSGRRDQELSFQASFEEKLKAWNLLGFINKIKIQYASNGDGWCQFWVDLNS